MSFMRLNSSVSTHYNIYFIVISAITQMDDLLLDANMKPYIYQTHAGMLEQKLLLYMCVLELAGKYFNACRSFNIVEHYSLSSAPKIPYYALRKCPLFPKLCH